MVEKVIAIHADDFCGRRGVGSSCKEILKHLLELTPYTFIVFGSDQHLREFKKYFPSKERFTYIENKLLPRRFYKLFLNYFRYSRSVDIFWYGKNYGTFRIKKNAPIVLTVHDIIGYAKPEYQSGKVSFLRTVRRNIRTKTISVADQIVAISEFTRDELIKYLQINPSKITVIYRGVNFDIFKPTYDGKISKILENKNFIFYSGAFNDYKNIEIILRAYLASTLPKNGWMLVLQGPDSKTKGNNKDYLRQIARESNYSNLIYFRKGLKRHREIVKYYTACKATVNGSLYEGFGLSILESIACGALTIASDIPPHREILNNTENILVSPHDQKAWENALNNVLSLSKKELYRIRAKNILQAREFNWERTMNAYLKLFQDL